MKSLHAHHRDKIVMANSAIGGLLRLQIELADRSGDGCMPEWWSDFYQESINDAISACAEQIEGSIEWLKGNATEAES